MNIAELPQDLLLQLGKDLDAVDILSLLQVRHVSMADSFGK
jgi:hypothetical protein